MFSFLWRDFSIKVNYENNRGRGFFPMVNPAEDTQMGVCKCFLRVPLFGGLKENPRSSVGSILGVQILKKSHEDCLGVRLT